MGETFYDVLGVPPDATTEEITAAYRARVKETHPDLSDEPDAADRFRDVVKAEEVLTDSVERARYDRLGHDAYQRLGEGFAGVDSTRPSGNDRDGTGSRRARRDRARTTGQRRSDWGRGRERRSRRSWGGHSREGESDRRRRYGTGTASRSNGGAETASSWWEQAHEEGTVGAEWGSGNNDAAADDVGFTFRVHEFDDDPGDGRWRPRLTHHQLVSIACLSLLYPALIVSTATSAFPLAINAVVGLCTLAIVCLLLTRPRVAITFFGFWSAVHVVTFGFTELQLVSVLGIVATLATWAPFAYAVALERMLFPS